MLIKMKSDEQGMTLFEVLIAISILITLVFTVSEVIKANIDMRIVLSEQADVNRKANRILKQLSSDLSHVFYVSPKQERSRVLGGKERTVFRIEGSEGANSLKMSYSSHKAIRENAKESSLAYVVYELRESQKNPGYKHLYRGEFVHIPENFSENPKMHIIATNVRSLDIQAWNGESWLKGKWDSSVGETKYLIPHLVRIKVTLWSQEADGKKTPEDTDNIYETYATQVYIPAALDYEEIKTRSKLLKI